MFIIFVRKYGKRPRKILKYNDCPHLLSCGGYDLLEKKTDGREKEGTRILKMS